MRVGTGLVLLPFLLVGVANATGEMQAPAAPPGAARPVELPVPPGVIREIERALT